VVQLECIGHFCFIVFLKSCLFDDGHWSCIEIHLSLGFIHAGFIKRAIEHSRLLYISDVAFPEKYVMENFQEIFRKISVEQEKCIYS